ncbi:hypothetical protein [Nocardioides speluncae]|uniref:hypothetical protein n=1 Tax=Nocardioides speluncae TaxID=2670337 RepID=UPI000D68F773|nr:hypothetical protein [Nocardioides speluncae]
MTERDLSTLVRDHVTSDEPPFALSPDTAIGQGRRVVRRRRAIAGIACAAVLTAGAAVAAPRLADDGGSSGKGIDPAIQQALDEYDAEEMPRIMDEHAKAVLADAGLDFGMGEFVAGRVNSDDPLPLGRMDEAEAMTISYGRNTGHRFSLELLHAGSEAEGNAREDCANSLADGTYLRCAVTLSDRGDVVVTRFWAFTPGLRGLNHDGGSVVPRSRLDDIDPRALWFELNVKVIKSDTFLTRASETVKAPDQAAAESRLQVRDAALAELAADPDLVMPRPE